MIGKTLLFMVSCILTNNFIFSRFLGCCPFLGVSNKVETAFGMGMAVTFVMALASLFTWAVYELILVPFHITYMDTITFILVIAALVQFVEMFLKKSSPSLYRALGIYLPLITTNCAVLGIAIINITNNYNVMEAFTAGFAAGAGFTLAIVLMSNIREKLDLMPVRRAFRGMPIAFISAGLMALSFMAFDKSLLTNLHLV